MSRHKVVRAEVSQPACASAHFLSYFRGPSTKTMRYILPLLALLVFSCGETKENGTAGSTSNSSPETAADTAEFQYQTDQFADVRIIRYKIPGFDQLSLQEKKLCYFLVESGLYGRDIMYAMNHRHNLPIP